MDHVMWPLVISVHYPIPELGAEIGDTLEIDGRRTPNVLVVKARHLDRLPFCRLVAAELTGSPGVLADPLPLAVGDHPPGAPPPVPGGLPPRPNLVLLK